MPLKRILLFCSLLVVSSCSMMDAAKLIPNPLEPDKGINTNVALGKNVEANNTKGLVTLDKIDVGRNSSTNTNNANSLTINNGMDRRMLILIVCLVAFIILLAGMAIPTRGQANRIKELKENLEYERARTNLTVEAAAGQRQETRQTEKLQ